MINHHLKSCLARNQCSWYCKHGMTRRYPHLGDIYLQDTQCTPLFPCWSNGRRCKLYTLIRPWLPPLKNICLLYIRHSARSRCSVHKNLQSKQYNWHHLHCCSSQVCILYSRSSASILEQNLRRLRLIFSRLGNFCILM